MSSIRSLASLLILCAVCVLARPIGANRVAKGDFDNSIKTLEEFVAQDVPKRSDYTELEHWPGYQAAAKAWQTCGELFKTNRLKEAQRKKYKVLLDLHPELFQGLTLNLEIRIQLQILARSHVFNYIDDWCRCRPQCNPSDFEHFESLLETYKFLFDVLRKSPISRGFSEKVLSYLTQFERCGLMEKIMRHM